MEEAGSTIAWWTNPGWYIAGLVVFGLLARAFMWVGAVNTEREDYKKFIREVRDKLDKILGAMKLSPVAGGSPLRLTDLGKEIADELNIGAWVDGKAPELFKALGLRKDYQIHRFSFDWIDKQFKPDPDLNEQIQACAYVHALTESDILKVYAVVLRDKLLEMARAEDSVPGAASA